MNQYTLFQWSDDYSVGINEIDNQHKIIFELINQLFQSALRQDHHSSASKTLDALIDYTRTHFKLEEKLLLEASYPNLAEHQQEHGRFVDKIVDVVRKFQAEEKVVTFELLNFLKHWLKEHILVTDMVYARFIAERGFSSDQWNAHAKSVVAEKNRKHLQQPWWKFWVYRAQQ
jgi:hemerythrin